MLTLRPLSKTFMNWSELRGCVPTFGNSSSRQTGAIRSQARSRETENVVNQHPAEAEFTSRRRSGRSLAHRKVIGSGCRAPRCPRRAGVGVAGIRECRGWTGARPDMNGPDPKDRVGTLGALHRHRQLLKTNSFGQACAALRDTLRTDPGNPMVRLYLGITQKDRRLAQGSRPIGALLKPG